MKSFVKHFASLSFACAVALLVASCNPSQEKGKKTTPPTEQASQEKGAIRVAYVNLDSVYNQYELYKDVTEKLNKTAEANQAQLSGKMRAMQNAAQEYQTKLQKNQILSREAAEAEERKLAKMQQEGQKLELQLAEQFAKQQQEANNKIFNTVKEEIEKYNQDKKYDFIFTNSGLQNLFYANPAYDITDEVIKYLNEAYAKKKEDAKK